MTVLTFPNIKPNFLKPLELPEYKISETKWKSGFSVALREQYQGNNTGLTLVYKQLKDSDLVTIINFYNSVLGDTTGFLLPTNFIKFQSGVTSAIANLGNTDRWKFNNEPVITLLVANLNIGKYDVNIELRAVNNVSSTLNTISNPNTVVYTPVANPVPATPPSSPASASVPSSGSVSSNNPSPVPGNATSNVQLYRASNTLKITQSIAANGFLETSVDLVESLLLLSLNCVENIRLRIYLNSTSQSNDLNRNVNIINYTNHGLLFECVFNSSIQTILTTPNCLLYNSDETNSTFLLTINNLSNSVISNFDIVFGYLPIEVKQ
jgi:hypothetical protein